MNTTILEPVTEVKTPVTRLLDLLAGWSSYVDSDESDEEEPHFDALVTGEMLADLYQEAAADLMKAPGEQEESLVRAFVIERILPLLLGQKP